MALQLNTRKTTLLDFTLRNEQDLNVLYILGTPGGQTLTLELTNAAGEPLDVLPLPKDAGKSGQFELVFRPGVLSDESRKSITVKEVAGKEGEVKLSHEKNADGTVSLLLAVKKLTLAPDEKLTFTLQGVAPDGRLGSRGTRVLLRYAHLQVHGADTAVGGFRETHLSLVTHVGKATIPLHVGVVGAGKVLNNGEPNRPVKLRVSNTSLSDAIPAGTQPVSSLYLAFDAGPPAEEWTLGTAAQVAAIRVQGPDPKGGGALVDATVLPGKTPVWVLPMPALAPGAYFDVVLSNITTKHLPGLTNVHLRYDNIPGYWDGHFVTQLEKSPLVLEGEKMGVGTSGGPATTLDVRTTDLAAAITVGKTDHTAGALYLGNANHGLKRNYSEGNDVGLYTTSANLYLSANGPITTQFVLANNGRVGIGTPDEPLTSLDVVTGPTGAIGFRNSDAHWDHMYQYHDGTTAYLRAGGAEKGLSLQVGASAQGSYGDPSQKYRDVLRLLPSGRVGVGVPVPLQALDVEGGILVRSQDPISNQGAYLQWNRSGRDGETWLLNQQGKGAANAGIRFGGATTTDKETEWARFNNNGFFGIGKTDPGFPLHVGTTNSLKTNKFGYLNNEGSGNYGSTSSPYQQVDVSIKAEGRIVCLEFNAISDGRLKTVVGRSDHAADLTLLRRLRITDYTMRDRVQFGDQAYKKVIGQEVEEIFPQAVHQHPSFLPDIYATAQQVQRQGNALLLGLPAGLPQAAAAGQRLKLLGPAGEVLATLAEAAPAGSRQLRVTGADHLADTPDQVFVFGLEHADVRTVDYEAIAMLNVSATQALAQQVQELQALTQTLPELRRRLETQDARVAHYEQLVPALAETLREQQQQLAELRAQVQRWSSTTHHAATA